MRLLRKNVRVSTTDSLGHGMDAVIVVVLFLGAGFGLDRLFGTTPVFMIALTLLGSVGLFVTFRYRYEARMRELESERANRVARSSTVVPTPAVTASLSAAPSTAAAPARASGPVGAPHRNEAV